VKEKVVLAIDPGTAKLGMAVVTRKSDGQLMLVWREIVQRENLVSTFEAVLPAHPIDLVIVGSGTQSKEIVTEVRRLAPSIAVLVVDERDTTMQARERYWEHNPRRGWRRLWPATLQVPPAPVDDFVALILAERVLNQG
jgi:RNase H-fold protein (predicted Holliday junction resolvase)